VDAFGLDVNASYGPVHRWGSRRRPSALNRLWPSMTSKSATAPARFVIRNGRIVADKPARGSVHSGC